MKEIVIKEENLNDKTAKLVRKRNQVIAKLCVKTSALWIASELIQSKLCPNRKVDEVYEALKVKGKKKVLCEKPEYERYLK